MIALYSPASSRLDALCALTRPNHHAYAKARGYTLFTPPHGADSIEVFDDVLKILESGECEQVLTHGADVLFTNHSCRVEDLPGDHVTVAREQLRWWPLNNDVMRWRATKETCWLLKRIRDDAHIWKNYPWLWQNHLWNLICTEERAKEAVTIVPARTMNSTPHPGTSQWQLGDWICHLVDIEAVQKVELAKWILNIAGKCDGTFYPE